MKRRAGLLALGLLLAAAPCPRAHDDEEPAYGRTPKEARPYGKWDVKPYQLFFTTQPVYRGPGREEPEPEGLKSVKLGLFTPVEGPSDDAEAGRNTAYGINLALEEANAAGGYKGLPFELVVKNDLLLWGTSSKVTVELAYRDKVWAVLGSIDSNSTHVAIRMALKIHIPFVNVGANSPDLTETNIPWLIRCNPDDRQTGYVLARHVFKEKGFSRVAALRSADRYGRTGIGEFRDAARRLGRPLALEILLDPGERDFTAQLDRVEASDVQAVVVWTKARQAGRLVRQLRGRGIKLPVFGADRLVTPAFLEEAGEAAEGVTATYWLDLERKDFAWTSFQKRFRKRFGKDPDEFAAYGYDAANLVLLAIRRGGLNRFRIREVLYAVPSYAGVSGTMVFDPTLNNVTPPVLTRVKGGRFVFHP
ncbi:MAG: ABC transporter substrate-binding protein [Elusimicrobia bacterium]|nr:ABC transporter substrate-binding protein [Elusimicrobiota bacterium]